MDVAPKLILYAEVIARSVDVLRDMAIDEVENQIGKADGQQRFNSCTCIVRGMLASQTSLHRVAEGLHSQACTGDPQ